MTRTSRSLAGLALAVLLLAGACDAGGGGPRTARTPVASPESEDTRVIGLVGTMSGPASWRGDEAFEGADLAVQVLNRSLPRGADPFELVTRDDGGDPERATEQVDELAASARTVGIVYAGPPAGLPPATQALALAGIPGILVFGDLYSARLLRSHLFQVSPPLLWQARRIATYLIGDRGYRRIGAVVERSLNGRTARAALDQALTAAGGRRAAVATYERPRPDLAAALRELKRARAEAIVVEGPPGTIVEVARILDRMGSGYLSTSTARLASAAPRIRSARRARGHWRPQLVGFDLQLSVVSERPPPGTAVASTYERGVHYLPVPEFRRFRTAFENWWGAKPLGRQLRAYEASRLIGWAANNARGSDADLARVLERLRGKRFGGSAIVLGPDDHTTSEPTTVGLWVVPRAGITVRERDRLEEGFPWVPLARSFSINGRRTDLPATDWKHLFRKPPPQTAPAPRFSKMRFGVTTPRADPVH